MSDCGPGGVRCGACPVCVTMGYSLGDPRIEEEFPTHTGVLGMRLRARTKEQWLEKARAEGDSEVGVGGTFAEYMGAIPGPSFMQRVLEGELLADELPAALEAERVAWEKNGSGELSDWLGMLPDEWRIVQAKPDMLRTVLMVRKYGKCLVCGDPMVLEGAPETPVIQCSACAVEATG